VWEGCSNRPNHGNRTNLDWNSLRKITRKLKYSLVFVAHVACWFSSTKDPVSSPYAELKCVRASETLLKYAQVRIRSKFNVSGCIKAGTHSETRFCFIWSQRNFTAASANYDTFSHPSSHNATDSRTLSVPSENTPRRA